MADDFLIKPLSSDVLLRAIELAMVRHEARRGLKSRLDMVCACVSALTPRERQVFELVVRGKVNKQIAYALGCTERTIKAHRRMVMEKMQVRSLAALVSLAEQIGVLLLLAAGPSRPLGISSSQVTLCGLQSAGTLSRPFITATSP